MLCPGAERSIGVGMMSSNRQWLGTPGFLAATATLAIVAFVSMNEISAVIGGVTVGDQAYPGTALYSVLHARSSSDALSVWAVASCHGVPIKFWLWSLYRADFPFIVGYTGFLLALNTRHTSLKIGWIVAALAAFDLVENAFIAQLVRSLPDAQRISASDACTGAFNHPVWVRCLLVTATLKALAAMALVLRIGWVALLADQHRNARRQVFKSLGVQ